MSNPLGARQESGWLAVCSSPDVCKTPMGSSLPPVPYSVMGKLEQSSATVPSVRFNNFPAFTISRSFMPTTLGDQAGVGNGVKSGTVGGKVEPTASSKNVRAQKNQVVRHGDECTLNSGNTKGEFVANAAASGLNAKAANMAAQAQNKAEEVFDAIKEKAKSAAQHYKDNVSQSLHEFGAEAMDKGGTIAVVGQGTALVGGLAATTVVGAVPGAAMVVGGGATAAVGGTVAGAGAITEGAATNLDAAADWILTGKPPDVIAMATVLVEKVVLRKVDQLIDKVMSKKGSQPSDKKEATKDKETQGKDTTKKDNNGSNGNGGGTTIKGKGQARCTLKTYDKNKHECEKTGATPHHVVPDHCFKEKGKAGQYYDGVKDDWYGKGLTICVGGATKSTDESGNQIKKSMFKTVQDFIARLAEHGKIHAIMDAEEATLGKLGTPKNTATLKELEIAGAQSVSAVTGCDAKDLERQLRDYHQDKKLPENTRLRADPWGKASPPRNQMGTSKGTQES